MSGRCLGVFFPPFDTDLVSLLRRAQAFLDGVQALPAEEGTSGWVTVEWNSLDEEWEGVVPVPVGSDGTRELADAGEGVAFAGSCRVAGVDLTVEVTVLRDASAPGRCRCTLRFGSFLHRRLYPDLESHEPQDEPARALIETCLRLASALGAAAFCVAVNDDDVHEAFDLTGLTDLLLTPNQMSTSPYPLSDARLLGVQQELVSRRAVARAWQVPEERLKLTTSGYVLFSFL